jgi:hypothetical protein
MTRLQLGDVYDSNSRSCPASKAVYADLDLNLSYSYLWQKQYTSHTMPTIE